MTDTTPPTPEPTPYAEPTPYTAPVGAPAGKSPILSIISLVAGILGLIAGLTGGWGLLFSIAGVVLGHLGQKRETAAKGFWLTGLITGYVGILANLVWIVIVIIGFIFLGTLGTTSY